MTIRKHNKDLDVSSKKFYRLSIQISLNGLSFCVMDTVQNSVLTAERVLFDHKCTPFQILDELKKVIEKHQVADDQYEEIIVLHRNTLFCQVPKPLFDEDQLPNYLKFNARILANDHIAYDELTEHDLVNVYVPFMNVNNYIYEFFGEFTYKHHGTVLIQSLLNEHLGTKDPVVYVHIFEQEMDIIIVKNKKLLLFNTSAFTTEEDFLYHLLFTLEQLDLNTEMADLKLLGEVEKDDPLYKACQEYVNRVDILDPNSNFSVPQDTKERQIIDFTVLNAL